eukprot:481998-Pleurochrysis_carterae.AAC.2
MPASATATTRQRCHPWRASTARQAQIDGASDHICQRRGPELGRSQSSTARGRPIKHIGTSSQPKQTSHRSVSRTDIVFWAVVTKSSNLSQVIECPDVGTTMQGVVQGHEYDAGS